MTFEELNEDEARLMWDAYEYNASGFPNPYEGDLFNEVSNVNKRIFDAFFAAYSGHISLDSVQTRCDEIVQELGVEFESAIQSYYFNPNCHYSVYLQGVRENIQGSLTHRLNLDPQSFPSYPDFVEDELLDKLRTDDLPGIDELPDDLERLVVSRFTEYINLNHWHLLNSSGSLPYIELNWDDFRYWYLGEEKADRIKGDQTVLFVAKRPLSSRYWCAVFSSDLGTTVIYG